MEALILYFVLFFPGIYVSPFPFGQTEAIPFSVLRELGRTFTYTIPSLALLWYLILDRKDFYALKELRPRKRELLPFVTGLPGLIIIGLSLSFLMSLFSGPNTPPRIEGPTGILSWVVMVFSCLGTGYLEESYFRFYLLMKLEDPLPNELVRIALSTILFSLCHMYEGPWGIINAILAGVLLSVIFIRYRSLHGIAWAHGVYNIFVYAMGKL